MKNTDEYEELSNEDEVSSIIYAALATFDKYKSTINKPNFNPVMYVLNSMYDLNFPVYSNLDFITRRGGARYIMNNVSSYRVSKGFKSKKLITLKRLFSKYGYKTKKDVIDFILGICENPDMNEYHFDEIKKAIISYNLYYKNNIIISSLPDDNTLYKDFVFNKSFNFDDGSICDSYVDVVSNNDTVAHYVKHIRYPDSKMLILSSGDDDLDCDSAAFDFYEEMIEWFNRVDPHVSNFNDLLISFISDINDKIKDKSIKNRSFSSASTTVIIITNNLSYVVSIGDTRAYYFKDGSINRIIRDENLQKEETTSSTIPLFSDFLRTFPSIVIGYNSIINSNFNPDLAIIPTDSIDGFLGLTKDIYSNLSDEEIEMYWNTFDHHDLLKMISYQKAPSRTNGYVLYRK